MGETPDFEFNFICQNDKLFKIFWGFLLLEYVIECIPEPFYLAFSWHMFLTRGGGKEIKNKNKQKKKTVLCQIQGLSSPLSCCSCGEVLSKWQHLAQLAWDCSSQSGNCAVVSEKRVQNRQQCVGWQETCSSPLVVVKRSWVGCPTAKCPPQPEKWSTSRRASKGIGVSLEAFLWPPQVVLVSSQEWVHRGKYKDRRRYVVSPALS